MSDFLEQMAQSSAERAAMARIASKDLDGPVYPLSLSTFDLIAEIKSSSPSEGALAQTGFDRGTQALEYANGGAAAISVLTEPSRFGGELSHIGEVAAAVADQRIPVMRKDFLSKPVQVLEARAAGASGVLLIAAMLNDQQLGNMLACSYEYSLFVLLESFDQDDLKRSVKLLNSERHLECATSRRLLFGINTRNLRSLDVDSSRLLRLASELPPQAVCVAESGLQEAADAADVAAWGYRAALVGSALMKAKHPAALLKSMLQAGREKAAS
jgi:indole-3-glycerol phosphate synthase